MLAGHVITGGITSTITTLKEQEFWMPALLVAKHVTDVVEAVIKLLPDG
jgi:hypothetical protein